MSSRFPFSAMPKGWYVVAASDEVKSGEVVSRRYFERDLALYRTASGKLQLIDAFCPHMGANLGKVGVVEGEVLRCGFHGLRFNDRGACVATPSGAPPPVRARLGLHEIREQNGFVLAWFDTQGTAPEWEVPVLDDEHWHPPRCKNYLIDSTPQETTENSVDLAHFPQLHGFTDAALTEPLITEGPLLTSGYFAHRPTGIPGLPKLVLPVHYALAIWGLGYSQVDVEIPMLRVKFRIWVLPVPIDEEHIELRLAVSSPRQLGPLGWAIRYAMHKFVCGEVDRDLDVWNHKIYLENPALTKDDGPIPEYRRWARQFYPDAAVST